MRAAYYEAFGGPQNVQVGERPDPTPDADHVLVRTHAAGMGIWDVGMMSSTVGGRATGIPGATRPYHASPASRLRGRSRWQRPGSARQPGLLLPVHGRRRRIRRDRRLCGWIKQP